VFEIAAHSEARTGDDPDRAARLDIAATTAAVMTPRVTAERRT